MEIDIHEVLDQERIREIAEEEVRSAFRKEFATPNDRERFVGNVASLFREQIIDDIVAEIPDFREQILAKVKGTIRSDSNIQYSLFREADGYLRRKPSLAQQYLEDIVKSKRGVIEARAIKLLGEFELDTVEDILIDQLKEIFRTNREDKED